MWKGLRFGVLLLLQLSLITGSLPAWAEDQPCDPGWKQEAEARQQKLKDCQAKGGDCQAESRAYEVARGYAGDCWSEETSTATPTPNPSPTPTALVATSGGEAAGAGEPAIATGFGGDLSVMFGQTTLHDSDWNPGNGFPNLASQQGYGIMVDLGGKSWPVMLALGYLSTTGSGSGSQTIAGTPVSLDGNATIQLIDVGLRTNFRIPNSPIVPYLGGGASHGSVTSSATSSYTDPFGGFHTMTSSASGNGNGVWIEGGIRFNAGPVLIGGVVRYGSCPASVSSSGGPSSNADLDGFLAAATAGFRF